MKHIQWLQLSLIVVCLHSVSGLAGTAFDVVTLKNGDIFNGTVAHETFALSTSYGQLNIPYSLIAELKTGKKGEPDTLTTHLGDRFHGKLLATEFTMLRILAPTLPLDVERILNIQFSAKKIRKKLHTPDAVETRYGDHFLAHILTGNFMLKSETSLHIIKRSDIHLLDIATLTDIEGTVAQITLNDGSKLQGQLMTNKIRLKNRYGNSFELPMSDISSLAVQVSHAINERPRSNYRQKLMPANLIQDVMRDGSPGPELIALRGGEFQRGDLQGNGDSDEQPAQTVHLKPFAIGLYEVTFAEYDKYVNAEGAEKPDDSEWGRNKNPVVNVSWQEVKSYIAWLNRQTGKTYRLPSDAEWEYAARAGSKTRYWWGNEAGNTYANCEGCGSLWDGEKTSPVGKFAPNPFGLHDTAGNVFEWVEDCWHDKFAEAPKDGSPLITKGCGKRVIRGGAWSFPDKEVRSANRWRDFPSRRSDDTGFRLARELGVER